MNGPSLATHEEAYAYWEPAKTVNDLHKQFVLKQVQRTTTTTSGVSTKCFIGQYPSYSMYSF